MEVEESTILQDIYGSLGIRNFMPEETLQYKELLAKGLVSNARKQESKKEDQSATKNTNSKSAQKFDFASLSEASS